MARTSDRVSSIAAKTLNRDLPAGVLKHEMHQVREGSRWVSHTWAEEILADAKTLAASALRQDEHKGFRGTIARLLIRKS
jgi:hypothetical protein